LTGWVQRTNGTTSNGRITYSFASGISEDFNLDFPHRGADYVFEQTLIQESVTDDNNDGVADVWHTGIGNAEEEAQADQDTMLD
jgi:hypothetical protein